jgi:hypothetical protein
MDPMLQGFENRFVALNQRSVELLGLIDESDLFLKPRKLDRTMVMFSCGEYILRSAAAVEQTSGGITTRLWDDPFEWTLPEELSTRDKVLNYLGEVETSRRSAFQFLKSDDDLNKEIPAPSARRPIFDLLLETLCRGEHFQGRAFAVFQMHSDRKLPRW